MCSISEILASYEKEMEGKDGSISHSPSPSPQLNAVPPKPGTESESEPRFKKKNENVGSGLSMKDILGQDLFIEKKPFSDSVIEISQNPMPVFETGDEIVYSYEIPQKEYNNKPLSFDSFQLYSNGDQDNPLIEKLAIEKKDNALVFSGVARNIGHLKIDLVFTTPDSQVIIYRIALLFIKPTYNCLPTDPNEPFQVAPSVSRYEELNQSNQILGASIRGRVHENAGRFRDDCFDFMFDPGKGMGAVVVSDGAGSSRYSRKAASIICQSFCNLVKDRISQGVLDILTSNDNNQIIHCGKDIMFDVVHKSFLELDQFVNENRYDFRDFYATMLSFIFAFCNNRIRILSFCIGDGGFVAVHNNEVIQLGQMDHGHYQNETDFLTRTAFENKDDFYKRIGFFEIESPYSILTMTDGVYNPWFRGVPPEREKTNGSGGINRSYPFSRENQLKIWKNICTSETSIPMMTEPLSS